MRNIRQPAGKRHTGTQEDNIKMDFKEIKCEDMDWVHNIQDCIQW